MEIGSDMAVSRTWGGPLKEAIGLLQKGMES